MDTKSYLSISCWNKYQLLVLVAERLMLGKVDLESLLLFGHETHVVVDEVVDCFLFDADHAGFGAVDALRILSKESKELQLDLIHHQHELNVLQVGQLLLVVEEDLDHVIQKDGGDYVRFLQNLFRNRRLLLLLIEHVVEESALFVNLLPVESEEVAASRLLIPVESLDAHDLVQINELGLDGSCEHAVSEQELLDDLLRFIFAVIVANDGVEVEFGPQVEAALPSVESRAPLHQQPPQPHESLDGDVE